MNIWNQFRTPFIVQKCRHLNKRNEEKNTITLIPLIFAPLKFSRRRNARKLKAREKGLFCAVGCAKNKGARI